MKSLERTARKVRKGHYVATHNNSPSPPYHASTNRAYFSDKNHRHQKSLRNGIHNNGLYAEGPRSLSSPPSRPPPRAPSALSYDHGGETGDIYVTSAAYKTPSEISRYSMPHRTYHHHPSKPQSVYSVASIFGIVFLIFGFATLIGSMIYCVIVCRDVKTPAQLRNEDLYWTKHWQKNIGYTPHEIDYKTDPDGYSVSKISNSKYSDRGSSRY
ncbi:hypothetical protein PVAND_000673 [Polypedilum vanderplanki]|uniref:Uncharacterized protein n=1 Tax=Polypedilum vanderplanki TaxID=319348 RepID=A0A9J6BKW0_POLVA|nr:hypothetical protein PVAND_000673 [Polypedilum vanderplanki]